ncbi:hypothetical protein [Algisphaera agarilytica]|uniref:Uncharacterized protein n=1 Tax=Algisphaera agarilytica TaxID=1385975 RepID=A0A7X0LK82_9BACT|nr:hypothetical protein [Algisphaera agarilytica]MBB6429647.1 hypothetical protein [Algisphaera agarilytica]
MEQALSKTRVRVANNQFVHTDKTGNVVACFELMDLEEITVEKKRDYVLVIAFVSLGIAAAVLCKLYIPIDWLSWLLTVVFGVCVILVILGGESRDLVVQTSAGTTRIPVNDDFEQAESFAHSLTHAARRCRFENGISATLSNDCE